MTIKRVDSNYFPQLQNYADKKLELTDERISEIEELMKKYRDAFIIADLPVIHTIRNRIRELPGNHHKVVNLITTILWQADSPSRSNARANLYTFFSKLLDRSAGDLDKDEFYGEMVKSWQELQDTDFIFRTYESQLILHKLCESLKTENHPNAKVLLQKLEIKIAECTYWEAQQRFQLLEAEERLQVLEIETYRQLEEASTDAEISTVEDQFKEINESFNPDDPSIVHRIISFAGAREEADRQLTDQAGRYLLEQGDKLLQEAEKHVNNQCPFLMNKLRSRITRLDFQFNLGNALLPSGVHELLIPHLDLCSYARLMGACKNYSKHANMSKLLFGHLKGYEEAFAWQKKRFEKLGINDQLVLAQTEGGKVRYLSLSGYPFSHIDIEHLFKDCPNLTILDVSNASNVNNLPASCLQRLHHLILPLKEAADKSYIDWLSLFGLVPSDKDPQHFLLNPTLIKVRSDLELTCQAYDLLALSSFYPMVKRLNLKGNNLKLNINKDIFKLYPNLEALDLSQLQLYSQTLYGSCLPMAFDICLDCLSIDKLTTFFPPQCLEYYNEIKQYKEIEEVLKLFEFKKLDNGSYERTIIDKQKQCFTFMELSYLNDHCLQTLSQFYPNIIKILLNVAEIPPPFEKKLYSIFPKLTQVDYSQIPKNSIAIEIRWSGNKEECTNHHLQQIASLYPQVECLYINSNKHSWDNEGVKAFSHLKILHISGSCLPACDWKQEERDLVPLVIFNGKMILQTESGPQEANYPHNHATIVSWFTPEEAEQLSKLINLMNQKKYTIPAIGLLCANAFNCDDRNEVNNLLKRIGLKEEKWFLSNDDLKDLDSFQELSFKLYHFEYLCCKHIALEKLDLGTHENAYIPGYLLSLPSLRELRVELKTTPFKSKTERELFETVGWKVENRGNNPHTGYTSYSFIYTFPGKTSYHLPGSWVQNHQCFLARLSAHKPIEELILNDAKLSTDFISSLPSTLKNLSLSHCKWYFSFDNKKEEEALLNYLLNSINLLQFSIPTHFLSPHSLKILKAKEWCIEERHNIIQFKRLKNVKSRK
jgi:hypothetical protein